MRKRTILPVLLLLFFLPLHATAQEELRIGTLTPLTGAGGPYGPGMLHAIQLAAEQVNAAGGVNGAQIRLFSEDTQTEPEAAVRAAQKLIEVNRVSAILGTWSSGITMAVVPLTIDAGILEFNVSGAPELTTLEDNNLVWRTQASNTLFGEAFAEIAGRLGVSQAATLAFNNPSGRGNTQEFARVFRENGGTVLSEIVYNPDQSTYRSELEQTLATNPEAIVMGSYLPDTTVVLKEWYQLFGDDVIWITPAWAVNRELVETLGAEVVEGVYAVDTVPSFESPAYINFMRDFEERFGYSPDANPYAPMVYDQMISLALAFAAAGSNDPLVAKEHLVDVTNAPGTTVHSFEDGLAALASGGSIDYDGASSKIDFDEAGDVRPSFGLYQVQDGVIELVSIIDLDEQ